MPASQGRSVAELVVEFLVVRKVDRVFGLQGGHVQPVWDQLGQRGVRIIDVRDEGAAVHMAHAHAVLTGQCGVVLVTAGPGVTNCVTAMVNAQLERAPVLLIGGCAKRPLVVTGRGALRVGRELMEFLDKTGAVYLDTQESRGLIPFDHPSVVGAMRGRGVQEADLVIVVGRKLDYQLAYGSPAVFPQARFIRIADCADELRDNRRGEVEIFASPARALAGLAQAAT